MDLYTTVAYEDDDEMVIWDREVDRPIAYLSRADASNEEFLRLRGLIEGKYFLPVEEEKP